VQHIGSRNEQGGRLKHELASNWERGAPGRLTFFNAILIWVLLVNWLSLISGGNTLYTLIEVVLGRSTLLGFLAFCEIVSIKPKI